MPVFIHKGPHRLIFTLIARFWCIFDALLRPKLVFILPIILAFAHPVLGATLRVQACDEDFRQMANWVCSKPGEKTPCYKFYFDVEEWKG
jgi:hypothetical protein